MLEVIVNSSCFHAPLGARSLIHITKGKYYCALKRGPFLNYIIILSAFFLGKSIILKISKSQITF